MTTASRPLATALRGGALRGRLAPATPPPGARPRAAACGHWSQNSQRPE